MSVHRSALPDGSGNFHRGPDGAAQGLRGQRARGGQRVSGQRGGGARPPERPVVCRRLAVLRSVEPDGGRLWIPVDQLPPWPQRTTSLGFSASTTAATWASRSISGCASCRRVRSGPAPRAPARARSGTPAAVNQLSHSIPPGLSKHRSPVRRILPSEARRRRAALRKGSYLASSCRSAVTRCASAAAMNSSTPPSSTAWVFEVSTPVRRSLTMR